MKYDHCAGARYSPMTNIQVHPCKYLVTVMLNQFKVLLFPQFFGTQTVYGGVSYCTASFGARVYRVLDPVIGLS